MNLTEGQLLFRLQDFHGAEQEALGIGDYEFFQESADIANALRELLQARRTIEELTAVVGQRNGECVRLHSLLDAAEKRIAELEAKLETADKLQDSAFRDGLKAGFSYGQTDDQSGFAQCMSAYSTRTGIKVKGE
ncbi:Ead protein [Salmonella enterica]|nr:Ead protein [Salmonella enterica]